MRLHAEPNSLTKSLRFPCCQRGARNLQTAWSVPVLCQGDQRMPPCRMRAKAQSSFRVGPQATAALLPLRNSLLEENPEHRENHEVQSSPAFARAPAGLSPALRRNAATRSWQGRDQHMARHYRARAEGFGDIPPCPFRTVPDQCKRFRGLDGVRHLAGSLQSTVDTFVPLDLVPRLRFGSNY